MKFMFMGILSAYLAGNVYVFVHLWRFLHLLSPFFRWLCAPLFWFAAVSLFIALFARDLPLPDSFFRITYNLGAIWMVFILYMTIVLLVSDLSGLLFPMIRRYSSLYFPVVLAFVAVLLLWGHVNYLNPKVERVAVDLSPHNGSGDGRQSADSAVPLRIVAVSDLHLGYATGKKVLGKYVEKINSLHPDVVLIGGDLIDNSVKPVAEERMWEELGQIDAPDGIFMVPGNHEYISGIDSVSEFISRTPIVLLRDSVVRLPGGLALVGRDDRSNRRRMDLDELLKGMGDAPVMLLEHQPYDIATKDSLGIALQFYGHTHRGQVWPMSLLVDKMYPQSYGYRKWNNSHVIVSSGLSLWGPPFRIGTDSDLWVIDLTL